VGRGIAQITLWSTPPDPHCLFQKGYEDFGLSCKDAQDKNDWRLRIKGQLANPGLSEKNGL